MGKLIQLLVAHTSPTHWHTHPHTATQEYMSVKIHDTSSDIEHENHYSLLNPFQFCITNHRCQTLMDEER